MSAKYEGWHNYDTWNCALWINNEYPLYQSALKFMQSYKGAKPYRDWVASAGLQEAKTKDDCKWISNTLSYAELNEMMRSLNA